VKRAHRELAREQLLTADLLRGDGSACNAAQYAMSAAPSASTAFRKSLDGLSDHPLWAGCSSIWARTNLAQRIRGVVCDTDVCAGVRVAVRQQHHPKVPTVDGRAMSHVRRRVPAATSGKITAVLAI